MKKSTVVRMDRPEAEPKDLLTEIARDGARQMLAAALEVEVESFIESHQELLGEDGRRRIVRNGHLPERPVQTGIGSIEVKVPRVRDRGGDGEGRGGEVLFEDRAAVSATQPERR